LRTTGDSQTTQEATAYGIFANAAIHFGKLVDLTLGVRESYDEKDFRNELFASDNFVPQFGGSTTVSAKDDWDATDYRATVDFNVTDDVMLYLTNSKAFRSGTFSVPGPVAVTGQPYQVRPQPALVPPETLYNDEIGIRTDLDRAFAREQAEDFRGVRARNIHECVKIELPGLYTVGEEQIHPLFE
jgi:iron complex outermembrane receptor protein